MITEQEIRSKIDAITEDSYMYQFKYGSYYGSHGYTPRCHWKIEEMLNRIENQCWHLMYKGDWRSITDVCDNALSRKNSEIYHDFISHLWDNMITLLHYCGVSIPESLNLAEWDRSLYPESLTTDEIIDYQIAAWKGDKRAIAILENTLCW